MRTKCCNNLNFDRPLSEEEARLRTPVVISCNEPRREVSAMQNIANKQIDRTFVFDKVLKRVVEFDFLKLWFVN